MDHRHMWVLNPKGKEQFYEEALNQIKGVLEDFPYEIGNARGDANTVPHTDSFIALNGRAPKDHETFYLPSSLSRSSGKYDCNTVRKPYDRVVVACLCILKVFLAQDMQLYLAGVPKDWDKGREIAAGAGYPITDKEIRNEN